jgi:uncharacterized OB-fold protein
MGGAGAYRKPLPRIDEESRGWWEALARHELYLQRCRSCDALRFYPRALCPRCLSPATEWVRASGRGSVYSFTVTYQNQAPGFRDELPYVLAVVELSEGVRLMSNVVGCPPERVRIGMPVEVVFEDVTPEVTLAKFRPVADA